jgi:hypothetical protein
MGTTTMILATMSVFVVFIVIIGMGAYFYQNTLKIDVGRESFSDSSMAVKHFGGSMVLVFFMLAGVVVLSNVMKWTTMQ